MFEQAEIASAETAANNFCEQVRPNSKYENFTNVTIGWAIRGGGKKLASLRIVTSAARQSPRFGDFNLEPLLQYGQVVESS